MKSLGEVFVLNGGFLVAQVALELLDLDSRDTSDSASRVAGSVDADH